MSAEQVQRRPSEIGGLLAPGRQEQLGVADDAAPPRSEDTHRRPVRVERSETLSPLGGTGVPTLEVAWDTYFGRCPTTVPRGVPLQKLTSQGFEVDCPTGVP